MLTSRVDSDSDIARINYTGYSNETYSVEAEINRAGPYTFQAVIAQ